MVAKWSPDKDRIAAIQRARSWYTGKGLETYSDTLFWSEKSPTELWTERGPERRESRIHVPVAADLALTAADFLFGSGLEVTLEDDADAATQDLLDVVLPRLRSILTLGADKASGLGETYFRLGWDEDDGRSIVSLVDPAKVQPKWVFGKMVEAIVRHDLPAHEGKSYVHYETYTPGKIAHELYLVEVAGERQTVKELGPIPLDRHPETADLDEEVELPGGAALENRMGLVDIVNKYPRDDREGGASDTDGQEPLMAAVDESITALQRDIRLGKARIIVDETMMNRTDALKGMRFDTTAEIFAPLMGGSIKSDDPIKAVQFDVRAEAHLTAAAKAAERVISLAGYSPESVVTVASSLPESAAARRLREARSLRTTGSKADRWMPKIREILQGLMVIEASLTNRSLPLPELNIELGEAVSPDLAERAGTVATLRAAKVMSIRTAVATLHPDWDDIKVQEEVDAIQAEAPDMSLGGLL